MSDDSDDEQMHEDTHVIVLGKAYTARKNYLGLSNTLSQKTPTTEVSTWEVSTWVAD